MTVGIKMHQTLAQCESVVSTFKSFALDTENQSAKQLYTQLAQTMDQQIVTPLRSRVNQLEQEEPTYKVYQQNMAQGGNAAMMGSASSGQQQKNQRK